MDDGDAEKDHDDEPSTLGLRHCRFDVDGQRPRPNSRHQSLRRHPPPPRKVQHLQTLDLVLLGSSFLVKGFDPELGSDPMQVPMYFGGKIHNDTVKVN